MSKDLALNKTAFENLSRFLDEDDAPLMESVGYATFNRDGTWTIGREKERLDLDEEYAVNITGMQTGYICWNDGEFCEEIVVPILGKKHLPPKDKLPDYGPYKGQNDGWQSQRIVPVKGVTTGIEFDIKKGNTGGSQKAFKALANAIHEQQQNGAPYWPIIKLDAKDYENKTYGGTTWNPVYRIVRWVDDPNAPKKPVKTGSVKDQLSELDDEIPF